LRCASLNRCRSSPAHAEEPALFAKGSAATARFALLIVDEIGDLPVTPGGGNLFFQLVNVRSKKGR
jgi:hypothetical protein